MKDYILRFKKGNSYILRSRKQMWDTTAHRVTPDLRVLGTCPIPLNAWV